MSGAQGVALQPGYRGFGNPEFDSYRQQGPSVDGAIYNGFRVKEREVFLPLLVYVSGQSGDGSAGWLDTDRRFFDTMVPGKTGTITVTAPNGSSRTLDCKFESDNQQAFDNDPAFVGWAPYGVTLIADDPFWYGEDVEASWGVAATDSFFGGTGSQLFFISDGAGFDTAKLKNSGQHESYVEWTIKGGFETIKVGVGSNVVSIPFYVQDTDKVTINTAPSDMRVMVNGVNKTSLLTSMPRFTPIAGGVTTNLSVSYTGVATGTVAARLRTRYYRAW